MNKKVAQKLMEPVYRYNFAREEFGENTAQERTKMRWGDVENIAKKIFLNLKHFNELYHAEIIQMIIDQRC
ncbi:MAG: hypothetical protein LBG59_07085 [Candidatus Peribacteria bacterium]|nr:hypothetical protein [Candidatus Peribacteria bacterium]